ARLALLDQPAAGVATLVRVVSHRAVHLGSENDSIAPILERFAHDRLRLPSRVHVGGVDEVDPRIERTMDDPDRLLVIGIAPGAEHHRAEAERAHLDPRPSELPVLHLPTVPSTVQITSSASVTI